eukprot:592821-Prymnesium_polylepis.1
MAEHTNAGSSRPAARMCDPSQQSRSRRNVIPVQNPLRHRVKGADAHQSVWRQILTSIRYGC